jgi:hemerythrin superfamily protein
MRLSGFVEILTGSGMDGLIYKKQKDKYMEKLPDFLKILVDFTTSAMITYAQDS